MADFKAILKNVPEWLNNAQASLQEKDAAAALKTAQKACGDCRNKGDKRGEGVALLMMAKAAFQNPQSGTFEVGARSASEALHAFQASKDKEDLVGEAAALTLASQACLLTGEVKEATSIATNAVSIAKKAGSTSQEAFANKALLEAGLLRLQHADTADATEELQAVTAAAIEAAQDATTSFRELGEKEELAQVVAAMASAYLLAGKCNMAIAKSKESQRLCQAMSDVSGEAAALMTAAKAYRKEGSTDAAMDAAQEAANLYASVADGYGQAEAYSLMEECQNASNKDRHDFTQRVLNKLAVRQGAPGGKFDASSFVPEPEPVKLGPEIITIHGFMGRAATVVPPKGTSSGTKTQNRFLLYNVSWN